MAQVGVEYVALVVHSERDQTAPPAGGGNLPHVLASAANCARAGASSSVVLAGGAALTPAQGGSDLRTLR